MGTIVIVEQKAGTCYAHACARAMLHCWRMVPCARTPSYKALTSFIISTYGENGGDCSTVFREIGNPASQPRREDVGMGDYYDLPALRLRRLVDDIQLFDLKRCGTRQALLTFYLDGAGWHRFGNFFRDHPNGTLTPSMMETPVPGEAANPTLQGHAVVIDVGRSEPGRIAIKNSWGTRWGSSGVFHVASLATLGRCMAYDVYWDEEEIGEELRRRIDQAGAVPMRRLESEPVLNEDPCSVLGQGNQAVVYRGTFENAPVAVKRCAAACRDRRFDLQHPNIVETLGWTFYRPTGVIPWDREPAETDLVCIVMELADGDLTKFASGLSDSEKRNVVLHMARAVEYLSEQGVVHLDVKPGNILRFDATWKLTDFGIAKTVEGRTTLHGSGTPGWTDPAIMSENTVIDEAHRNKLDVYSIGRLMQHLGVRCSTCPSLAYDCMKPLPVRPTAATVARRLEFEDTMGRVDALMAALTALRCLDPIDAEVKIREQFEKCRRLSHSLFGESVTPGVEFPPEVPLSPPTPTPVELGMTLWERRGMPDFAALLVNRPVAVHLKGCDVHQTDIDGALSSLHLMALDLTECGGVTSIASIDCRSLMTLSVSGTGVTQSGILGVEAPLLKWLAMNGNSGINDVSALLWGCRTLTALDLSHTGVTQSGIAGVEAPLLEQLLLAGCKDITDITSLLRGCRTLMKLGLSGTGVSQGGITGVEAPLLESLWLNDCSGITDLRSLLRGCRTLTTLDVRGTGVTQSGIAGVEAPLLNWLVMDGCSGVTDVRGLLRGCRGLEMLSLNGTGVGQAGIMGVEAPLLQSLYLNDCSGVVDLTTLLRGCRTLTILDLNGTGVSQAGIAGVEAPLLQELYIAGCRGINDVKKLLLGCRTLTVLSADGTGVSSQLNVWHPFPRLRNQPP